MKVTFNDIDHELIIAGQITRSAVFGDGHNLGTKRHKVQLCPTIPWAISFQFPEPVDWDTRWPKRISETVLEIRVEKLSSSLARAALEEAALMEAAIVEAGQLVVDMDAEEAGQ